ncbi:MAG: cupin domain-containing protein [Woeseiaceae bacterium]
MLQLPGNLTAESFLATHWQKAPLFMPSACDRLRATITRNELAWLATLDDVESRIVYTDRSRTAPRYRAVSGPFDETYLRALPQRDWTLLVHDVEKHIPVLRRLFGLVPFVPDWRIDDLMVSFAAPGGGVGPHRDHYDVFLCQGIGVREWRVSADEIRPDDQASRDLALLREFEGETYEARAGDVLYLPPGVAHWGTAQRAAITYSIGMRAPQLADIATSLPDDAQSNPFYADPDLVPGESQPGRISPQAVDRAAALLGNRAAAGADVAASLGRFVTQTKDWLTPERLPADETAKILPILRRGGRLAVHGMARIAYDPDHVYVNGRSHALPEGGAELLAKICSSRRVELPVAADSMREKLLVWMLESGAFERPGNL